MKTKVFQRSSCFPSFLHHTTSILHSPQIWLLLKRVKKSSHEAKGIQHWLLECKMQTFCSAEERDAPWSDAQGPAPATRLAGGTSQLCGQDFLILYSGIFACEMGSANSSHLTVRLGRANSYDLFWIMMMIMPSSSLPAKNPTPLSF